MQMFPITFWGEERRSVPFPTNSVLSRSRNKNSQAISPAISFLASYPAKMIFLKNRWERSKMLNYLWEFLFDLGKELRITSLPTALPSQASGRRRQKRHPCAFISTFWEDLDTSVQPRLLLSFTWRLFPARPHLHLQDQRKESALQPTWWKRSSSASFDPLILIGRKCNK